MAQSAWRRGVELMMFVSAAAGLAACGGAGPSALLQVAGSYEIRKTFTEDSCDGSLAGRAVSNEGVVSQQPGGSAFVLTDHGSRSLPGTVSSDGSFRIEASNSIVHGSIPAVDTFFDGRFSAGGFHVRNVTELASTPTSPSCRLVAEWDATKVGTPNVIP